MSTFYDVVAGNPTQAADLNQLVDALNGTVSAQLNLLGASANSYRTLNNIVPSVPASDSIIEAMYVTGDSQVRYGVYLRHSDGYSGIEAGNGTSITAHLYAQAGGWTFGEGMTVLGQAQLQPASNTTNPLIMQLPSAPSSDQSAGSSQVSGDTIPRIEHYLRGADGYGGLRGGAGSSVKAHLYAQSFGWQIDESLSVLTTLYLGSAVSGSQAQVDYGSSSNALQYQTPQAGTTALGHEFITWSGSAQVVPFSIGGQFGNALSYIDSSGNLVIGGPANVNQLVFTAGMSFSATSNGYCYWNSTHNSPYGFRFDSNGTVVAHLDNNSTNTSVLLHSQQLNGSPDAAEVVYCRNPDLPGGTVVCPVDEARTLGELEEIGDIWDICTHDDCPSAKIISDQPGLTIGGRLLFSDNEMGHRDFEVHPDPHWKAIAICGRVPAKVSGPITRRMPVVSDGKGGLRPWKPGDLWVLGCVAALHVTGRGNPLPEGMSLVILR
jgi:hypothetical protein